MNGLGVNPVDYRLKVAIKLSQFLGKFGKHVHTNLRFS